jgi:hypothetical protein
MRNTADVTGGKPIVVLLQSISGVSAINPLVAFCDVHGGKREVIFFYFVPDTTVQQERVDRTLVSFYNIDTKSVNNLLLGSDALASIFLNE